MTFTKARIEAMNGPNILAFDTYGYSHQITLSIVHPEDVDLMGVGKDVLINDTGLVENPSASFRRWRNAELAERMADTQVIGGE